MELARRARDASRLLAVATTEQRNTALKAFRNRLASNRLVCESSNDEDKNLALLQVEAGCMSKTLYDRLDCSGTKFDQMLTGIDDLIDLPDPVGQCDLARTISTDLNLYRISCPIGVVLVIFESRPDAAVAILSLCLKSGNAAILKGGAEAKRSIEAIRCTLYEALEPFCEIITKDAIQFISSREEAAALFKLDSYIDLIIPRGSNELVRHIKSSTSIPVLGHADGICVVYVDDEVDISMALKVVEDSKLQYPAACNSMETLLIHENIVSTFLIALSKTLSSKGVKYRADDKCLPYLPEADTVLAKPDDFMNEYLTTTMAVKAVIDVDAAINHINTFGSAHTDVILTSNSKNADRFMQGVDSAGVLCNCSSRFADGFRYGFGAEVGISTNRIHARGPVGLDGLVTYKYRIYGKGQCVEQFSTTVPDTERKYYDHKPLTGLMKNADEVKQFQEAFFI